MVFLRILEIVAIAGIVIYGLIKMIEMFTPKSVAKRKEKGLEALRDKAKKAAADKASIKEEALKNEKIINDINKTLNK